MTTVAELLRNKTSARVHHVAPDTPLLDAVRELAEKRIGALVVLGAGRLVGILSERDYMRQLARCGGEVLSGVVADLMTAEVLTVSPRDSVQHCLQLMTDRRLRHLPVMADGELIGLLSIGDLVKQTIDDQAGLIAQLERYIRGE